MIQRLVFVIALLCASLTARAADAPEGPLRIVSGYAPGGSSDRAARILADALQRRLGTPVIVENRTGAGGRLAAQQVKATPAGQNVLMIGNPAVMVVAPLVLPNVGYDPDADFVPVSWVNDYEFGIAVGPAVPVRELSHLLAWLRANPEQANFGVPATGSLPHFFALMIGEHARISPQVVGYRGSAQLATDLLGGQLPVGVDSLDSLEPLAKAGKLRLLATSGERRSATTPDVPTFREAGLGLTAKGWGVLFAPASMPRERVQRLSRAVQEIMSEKAVREQFLAGQMTPVASDEARTRAMLAAFRTQWAPVIRKSGYTP
jgi:tripartite-type tricarboxylate transporter receptor subunit TctC